MLRHGNADVERPEPRTPLSRDTMRYFFICVRDWWIGWRRGPIEAVEDATLPDPLLDEFNALERLVAARKEQERLDAMTPEQRAIYEMRIAMRYNPHVGQIGYGGYLPASSLGYDRYANRFDQLDGMQQARNSYQDVYWQQNLLAQFGLANQQQRGWDGQG